MITGNVRNSPARPAGWVLAAALLLAPLFPAVAETLPTSIEEALQGLETSQAPGARWEKFGDGSYATFRQKSDTQSFGDHDESYRETLVRRTESSFFIKTSVPGTGDEVTLPKSRQFPELAAKKARFRGEETVYFEDRRYDTQVYVFKTEARVAYIIFSDIYKFWLVLGVPSGVVKVYHEKEEVNLLHPERGARIRSALETVLTDTDVPILVGNETILCYCYKITGTKDGIPVTGRNCFSDMVPGGLVRQEAVKQEDDGGVGTATHQLVEYQAFDAR